MAEPILIGVEHRPGFVEQLLPYLQHLAINVLGSGKTIGIEVSPAGLREARKLVRKGIPLQRAMPKYSGRNFLRLALEAEKIGYRVVCLSSSALFKESEQLLQKVREEKGFVNKQPEEWKKKNIPRVAGMQRAIADTYVNFVRENDFMVRKVERHKPDIIITGLAHALAIQKHFGIEKIHTLLKAKGQPHEALLAKYRREIENKEKTARKIIEKLNQIKEQAKIKESASIFQGKRGIRTIFEDILNYKEYLAFASGGKFKEILGTYFDQFQIKKRQKKIKSMILIDEALKGSDYVKSIRGEIRFLPKEYNYPTATFIYENKVAFFVFTDYPTAFLIESKEVAESYRNYFALLWKIAKK